MASSVVMNIDEIIKNLLASHSDIIKQGTADLKSALKKPETILQLCEIVVSNKEVPLRHYAAIILHKRLAKIKYWKRVPQENQAVIKQGMLNAIIHEQHQPVRTAISQLVGRLIDHGEGHYDPWADSVFNFVDTCCRSADATESERGSSVFATLADTAGDQFIQHLDHFCAMFKDALLSTECNGTHASATIYNIIMGMSYLVAFIIDDKIAEATYQNSIPLVVKCLTSLAPNQPDRFCSAFELLENMVECTPQLLLVNVRLLMDFCLETCSNNSLEKIVRVKTLGYVSPLIRSYKQTVLNQQMIVPIITVVFKLMTVETEDDEDGDGFDYFGAADGSNIMGVALQALDTLAFSISPDKVLPPLLECLEIALQNQDPLAHRAAYLSMAAMVEGYSETICNKYLEKMVNIITSGLAAPIPLVRDAAFFALGHFAEHLQPEISSFAPQILPILLEFLSELCKQLRCGGGAEPSHIDRMFYALFAFCENLGPDLVPHLPSLMERLFEAATPASSVHVRELALGAIAGAVNTAKEHMVPYFGHLISLLQTYLVDTDQQDIVSLRATAVNTLAAVARNVGQQTFLPLAKDSMNYGLTLLNATDDPDVRSSVYNLLGALASVVHEEMAAIFPDVLERIYSSVVFSEYSPPEDEDSEAESDDLEDAEDEHGFAVENAYLNEKELAICALQEFAENTGSAFMPHVQAAFDHVFKVIDNTDDDVRKVAIEALTTFVKTLFKFDEKATTKAIKILIPKMYSVVHNDEESSIVLVTLESIGELLRELKEVALTNAEVTRQIDRCICDVLKNKTACQVNDNNADPDNDMSEIDGLIVEAAAEILPLLGYAMDTTQFDTHFKRIYHLLLEKCQIFKMHDHLTSQRASIYGSLGECFGELAAFSAKYFDEFLPLFTEALKEVSHTVRKNAIYGLGELVANAGWKSYGSYPCIMSALSSAVAVEKDAGCLDNICGALARIILNNYLLVSLEEVMPVWLQLLPPREAFDDYDVVFKCLKLICTMKPDVLHTCCEKVISLVVEVHFKGQFPDPETKADAVFILKNIRDRCPQQFNAFKNCNPVAAAYLDAI